MVPATLDTPAVVAITPVTSIAITPASDDLPSNAVLVSPAASYMSPLNGALVKRSSLRIASIVARPSNSYSSCHRLIISTIRVCTPLICFVSVFFPASK